MGVLGLWRLIEGVGKPVAFETLEDQVIVIDISIWLHQVVKGYTDGKGGHIHNSHLLGLFNRICKLLYFRIKPIFIFDGKVCSLKWQTIAKRSQQKSKLKAESEKIEELLLQSLAKEKVIKEALGLDTKALSLSPIKKKITTKSDEKDDMFKLPENSAIKAETLKIKPEDDEEEEDEFSSSKKSYGLNIQKIDLNSSYFKSLAPDIRHEILVDIKDTRKQNTWGRLKELPVDSDDFSTYQMSRLLKRRQVQVKLEEAEKEMGGKVFSISELETLLAEDGVLEVSEKHAQVIAGDENTRFLLVRDIAKAISEAKERESIKNENPQPGTSRDADNVKFENEPDDDYDLDLQKAIQMSLGNDEQEEINDESNEPLKLNQQQRKKFVGSFQTHGLVKGFMKEYAEMNDDDIKDFIEATQIEEDSTRDDSLTQKFPHTDRYVLYGTPEKSKSEEEQSPQKSPERPKISVKSLKELQQTPKKLVEVEAEMKEIVITVNSSNYTQEEDIFADIFEDPKIEDKDLIVLKSPEKEEENKVLDVEIASISSDDNTIEYEIPEDDFTEVVQESEQNKITVSETIIIEEDASGKEIPTEEFSDGDGCENEKFWSSINEIEEEYVKSQANESAEKTPEKSENQKFYDIDDENFGEAIEEKSEEPSVTKYTSEISIESQEIKVKDSPPIKIIENELKNNESEEPKIIQHSPIKVNHKSEKEEIIDAAQTLRTELTDEQLLKMEEDIRNQQKSYEFEMNKLDRQGTSITASMSRECKELLKLFGIPYIDAPTEAEAQCAFLNAVKLADGIITDDSDVLLFGAERVYKNFFLQKKVVKKFEMEDIKEKFKLDRKKLIQLAMLVGSDYTIGLHGVGTVTALEILAAFPPTPEEENSTDVYQSLLSSLRKFRDWFENSKKDASSSNKVLKSKLKNVEMIPGFPNINVMKAYLEPSVDTSLENFTWGQPDIESIYEFTKTKLGWTRLKTQEVLDPVMKRFKERKQKKMEDYFKVQLKKRAFDEQKLSKRVQMAIGKMSGNPDAENIEESSKQENIKGQPKKATKRKTTKKAVSKKEKKEIKEIQDVVLLLSEDDEEPPENKATPDKNISTDPEGSPQKSSDEKNVNAFSLLKSPQKSPQKSKKSVTTKLSRKRKTNSEPKPSTSESTMNNDEVLRLSEDEPPEKKATPDKIDSTVRKESPQKSNNEEKVNAFNLLKSPQKPKTPITTRLSRKRKTNAEPIPSTSTINGEEILQPKQAPRIPETKQIIPQREKDKSEQELNKKKAIEIFKKSQKNIKKKK